MKELILNFFSFGLAVSLERFLSFLLIPLYASVFSVTEFGVIDLVQTFIGVVTIFCFLQLETSLQRFYYEYEGEDKKKFLFSIFSLVSLSSHNKYSSNSLSFKYLSLNIKSFILFST